ncbi:MAG: M20/M25/M40 family metallo-hydrolase [Deltaproteobacteria bacterium]|nr:M20/M25/M40 family metallo-hydrolase [Deltaproteobacteria bacterium]
MSLVPSAWIERSIQINSETDRSNLEMVEFLKPLIAKVGLKIEEQRVVENGATFVNLMASSHSPTTPNLMVFNTHLDTVSGGSPELWTKCNQDPFRATLSRSRVYGLGSADVKLDFLCKILAAEAARPWTRPICLVGTYGEERGLIGASELLSSKRLIPKVAVVGEPSNLELIYAHKGHLVMTVRIPRPLDAAAEATKSWKGKAAHSSTPDLGTNALVKGLTDCFKRAKGIVSIEAGTNPNRIPDDCRIKVAPQLNATAQKLFDLVEFLNETSRELIKRRDSRFTPATCSLSLTMARSPEGFIELTFDVRILPEIDVERLRKRLTAGIEKLELSIIYEEVNYPLRGKKDSPLMREAAKILKTCRVVPQCKTKASATEASVYQKYGAQAFVFGPGISIGNVHRPNEYNLLRHLDTAVHFYTKLMQLGEGVV